MKLHGNVMSGASMRVAACLHEKEIDFKFVNVDLRAGTLNQEPHISLVRSVKFQRLKMAILPYSDTPPFIKSILLLDSDGKRIAVKYYSDDWPSNYAKLAFEKSAHTKT